MTREAVEQGFETYVEDIVSVAYDAFDVTAAFRGGSTGGGRLVSQLVKKNRLLDQHVVQPALQEYKTEVLAQFEPILDYAAAPDAEWDSYRDTVLARDMYYQELREDIARSRRQEIRERLLERHRRLGEAARPLVETDEDEFWPAVEAALSRSRAETLVEDHFAFTSPLTAYPDAFRFDATVDPSELLRGPLGFGAPTLTLDFTDEVRRVMIRAERATIDQALADLDRRYD